MLFAEHAATRKFNKRYEKDSEILDLSNQSLTGEDMPALADFLKTNTKIINLILDHNRVGSGLRYLTCKRITHFSIKHNRLTDDEITAFVKALLLVRGPHNTLEAIDLENNKISDRAACALSIFDQPLSLFLDNNQIGLIGATALAKNKKWFKMVTLMNNPLPPEAITILKARFDGSKGFGFWDNPEDDQTPSCFGCVCS